MRIEKKILLSGPVSQDSFTENILHNLIQMGAEVFCDYRLKQNRYTNLLRRIKREIMQKAILEYIPPDERKLIKIAKKFKPEIFLAPTQIVQEQTLIKLKNVGVKVCIAWWGDSPGNMKRFGLLSREWDIIYFKDPEVVAKYRRVGIDARLLHEAMNPEWHRPIAKQANDLIIIAGNFYGYRQFLVRELMRKGIKFGLYGGRLPRWVYPEIERLHAKKYIIHEEKSQIFGEGLACLNSTHIIEGNSMNCRAFEIAGSGGLHLMEYKPIINECFEPEKEVLTFDSIDELIYHIERARKDPYGMEKIRKAAALRAHNEHTYRHRLDKIFKDIKAL